MFHRVELSEKQWPIEAILEPADGRLCRPV